VNPSRLAALLILAASTACGSETTAPTLPPPPPADQAAVYTASGNITAAVDSFRNLLGPSNGGTAGEQATGRREISWDGAGANPFNNKNNFPPDFFNTTVRSGAVFTTDGLGFRNDSLLFAEVNPNYPAQFAFFSATKVFTPVGSNLLDVLFEVAGQPTPASVNGFGIVFSDVDVADKTTIELFGTNGASLGVYSAPVRTDAAGLSFLAVKFESTRILRVRVTLGTGALGAGVNDISAGGTLDLVVFDNLVFGEPRKAF
jgi:hypothetical protein